MLAARLVGVLPDTLAALEAGRIDLTRAEVLSAETALLDDPCARAVERVVLRQVADGDGPWNALSPRRWRAQIQRTVIQVDDDSARRRREAALRDRAVRAWPQGDGTGVLQIIGQDSEIAFADGVITDLALAWPTVGADGEKLSMDQRRVDAVMDLMRRVAVRRPPSAGASQPRARDRPGAALGHLLRRRPRQERPGRAARSRRTRPDRPALRRRAGPNRDRRRRRHPRPAGRAARAPCSAPSASRTHRRVAGPATSSRIKSEPPYLTCLRCRPGPTNPRWRSPSTSARCTPGAPPMTAPASRPAATSTTTSPGPADPPASPTCLHAAGATTSSRPEASYTHACTPTGPSPPPPCSAQQSPRNPSDRPDSDVGKLTHPSPRMASLAKPC